MDPLDRAALLRELRQLHSDGVWNSLESNCPKLAAEIGKVRSSSATGPFGPSLAAALEAALPTLSVGDQAAVRLLFGLHPHEHLGPRQRHQLLPGVARRTWTQFRGSPFDQLCERLLKALGAQTDTMLRGNSDQGFFVRELSQTYVEPTHVSPLLTISEVREIVATVEVFPQWSTIHRLQLRSAVAPPVLQFIGDGDRGRFDYSLVKLGDQDGDGFNIELRVTFETPLRRGESCRFEINKTIAVDVDKYLTAPGPRFTGFEGLPRIDKLKLRVQFDPLREPPAVHKVSGCSVAEYSSLDPTSPFVAQLGSKSSIAVEWDTPTRYRWYGLRWE